MKTFISLWAVALCFCIGGVIFAEVEHKAHASNTNSAVIVGYLNNRPLYRVDDPSQHVICYVQIDAAPFCFEGR
jgi:hypothetical protein